MANILINCKCNLRCEYCFASEYIENNKDNITKEQFEKIVEFITRTPRERIGIIGGEPLLHKDFDYFITSLIHNDSVKVVTLFTNGIELKDKLKLLSHPKIHILINVNERKIIGESNYAKLKANMDEIYNEYNMQYKVSLGLNVYKPDANLDEFFECVDEYKLKQIRVSIVVPKDKNKGSLAYFKNFLPTVMRLLKMGNDRKIGVGFDCNLIPLCLMDKELIKLFCENEEYLGGRKYVSTDSCSSCKPVIDISPDFTAIRCFGLSERKKLNIFDYDNINEIKNAFFKIYDSQLKAPYKECEDCRFFKCGKCYAGCLAFNKKI